MHTHTLIHIQLYSGDVPANFSLFLSLTLSTFIFHSFRSFSSLFSLFLFYFMLRIGFTFWYFFVCFYFRFRSIISLIYLSHSCTYTRTTTETDSTEMFITSAGRGRAKTEKYWFYNLGFSNHCKPFVCIYMQSLRCERLTNNKLISYNVYVYGIITSICHCHHMHVCMALNIAFVWPMEIQFIQSDRNKPWFSFWESNENFENENEKLTFQNAVKFILFKRHKIAYATMYILNVIIREMEYLNELKTNEREPMAM